MLTLGALAEKLGAELVGEASHVVDGLGTIQSASSSQLTFLANPRYRSFLEQTGAGAVLIPESQRAYCPVAALIVKDPYLAFAKASAYFEVAPQPQAGSLGAQGQHHEVHRGRLPEVGLRPRS